MATRRRELSGAVIRPQPPEKLFDNSSLYAQYIPAPEVVEWLRATFLDEGSRVHNADHLHLKEADICVLWTNDPYAKHGRRVAGTAEILVFRCSAWQKGRQEQQMREWFGRMPDFLITLDANYAAQASDAEFCALVEHELYHCGQEHDEFGAPKFTRGGMPKFAMRGHDVEEFVGIVRRYGAGNGAGDTAKLVEAAKKPAEVANIDIARACGTCILRAA
jgi:hypothetical protein